MARVLSPDDLYRSCEERFFSFRPTEALPPLDGTNGQERALDSIDFGLNLDSTGFNIYVLGESGTGKTSAIRSFISKKAEGEKGPPGWGYVPNLRDRVAPIALSLDPGRGGAP